MTDGEVAVREGGRVTALDTHELDEDIAIDLDHDPPLVGVPENVGVTYEHTVDDEPEPHVETDGGFVSEELRVRQYGLGLREDLRNFALAAMVLLYAAGGYLWNTGEAVLTVVVFGAAFVLTYLVLGQAPEVPDGGD